MVCITGLIVNVRKDQTALLSQGHIGLNEVAIGISVPLYWGRLMARIVGAKTAEHLCKFAVLLQPKEAAAVSQLFLMHVADSFALKSWHLSVSSRANNPSVDCWCLRFQLCDRLGLWISWCRLQSSCCQLRRQPWQSF